MSEQPTPPDAGTLKPIPPEAPEPSDAPGGQADNPAAAPPPVPPVAPGFGDPLPGGAARVDTGVPTFDSVREKIEQRYGTALGMTELAEESAAGRSRQEAQEQREAAARDKLEAIRRSLHPREDST